MKTGGVHQEGLVGAVGEGLVAQVLDLLAEHDGDQLHPDAVRQLTPLAEQLPGDAGRLPFGLLDEDPDAAVLGQLFRQGAGLGVLVLGAPGAGRFGELVEELLLLGGEVHVERLRRAGLDALQTADALFGQNYRLPRFVHADSIDRAGTLAAGAAGDAFTLGEAGHPARFRDLLHFSHHRLLRVKGSRCGFYVYGYKYNFR